MSIELSVALPMFRAKYIGWLPLEGLIRQEDVDFEWELVVAEELNDETFGEKNIRAYEDRLKAVGCVKIVYKGLDKWIPLSNKWVLLANMCDENSRILVLHAADNYSAPLRLARHCEVFTDSNVCLHIPSKAIYYNISTEKIILHDTNMTKRKDDCAARAMLTDVVRRMSKSGRRNGVDGWLRGAAKSVCKSNKITFGIFFDKENNDWQYGLNTYGLNNIIRREEFIKLRPPFKKCSIDINKTIPKEVLDKLKDCKKFVNKHKKGFKS